MKLSTLVQGAAAVVLVGALLTAQSAITGESPFASNREPTASEICLEHGNLDASVTREARANSVWGPPKVTTNFSTPPQIRAGAVWLRPVNGSNAVNWTLDEGVVACQVMGVFDPADSDKNDTHYFKVDSPADGTTFDPDAPYGRLVSFTLLVHATALQNGRGDLEDRD